MNANIGRDNRPCEHDMGEQEFVQIKQNIERFANVCAKHSLDIG